jgi:pimeloyl-ACP methyl ester carboxylesterase
LKSDTTVSLQKSRLPGVAARVLVACLLIYTLISVFGAMAAMEIPRFEVKGSPADVGLTYQDASFNSRTDGLLLKGWFIPGAGEIAVIVVHGGFQNRLDEVVGTLDLAKDLNTKGFGILLFDLRGRGESQGRGRTLTNVERDLGGALDYVKSLGFATSSIGILGFCSGAASVCAFVSTEKVGALVLDGCFTRVESMFKNQAAQRHIPAFLVDFFYHGVRLGATTLYRYREVDPLQVVADVKAPILFVHEENDELISLEDTRLLLDASTNPSSTMWEIPGAPHSEGYKTIPGEYIDRIAGFLNSNLKVR